MSQEKYPIIKIDRMTAQNILPVFMNKGIFANYKALPTKEELLEKRRHELGAEKLTQEEERLVLAQAKMYRGSKSIIRDYGKYQIGFGLSFLMNDSEEVLSKAMDRISLYTLGHKLAALVLSEVYIQRKFSDIEISKEKILAYLGYSTEEKHIYKQIDDVMFSLMTLNYFIYEYSEKFIAKVKSRQFGAFIYNVKSDSKSYALSVNEKFVGSISYIVSDGKKEEKDFSRGYFDYPTSLLPLTKNYSMPAYLLANFLISDSGNSKLNGNGYKVVAYQVRRLIEKMQLKYSRPDHLAKAFLDALEEVEFICVTKPTLKELKGMKSKKLLDEVIRIHIKSDIEEVDEQIKSIISVTKQG